jgi:hypothetical protein
MVPNMKNLVIRTRNFTNALQAERAPEWRSHLMDATELIAE